MSNLQNSATSVEATVSLHFDNCLGDIRERFLALSPAQNRAPGEINLEFGKGHLLIEPVGHGPSHGHNDVKN